MDLKRKSIAISTVLLLGLLAYLAPNRHPVPEGSAEHYWAYACGVEFEGYSGNLEYVGQSGIFPDTDGWYFYFIQGHHGRWAYRVSPEPLLERVPDVYERLEQKLEPNPMLNNYGQLVDRRSQQRADCVTIKSRTGEDHARFLDDVSAWQADPSAHFAGQEGIDSFQSQWSRAKLYWVSLLFEAVFLWFWWVYTFHRGAFGRLNARRDLQIAFSPLLLFIPFYLGYAPYMFTFGPTGGILYPGIALLFSIPFAWFPFNPVEVWILQHIPQPLWHISQVPVGMNAISFWASVSPTALLLFAGIVQGLAFGWRRRKRRRSQQQAS